MHKCDYCVRDFKTVQGLLGHQRMVHGDSGHGDSGHGDSGHGDSGTMVSEIDARLERIERVLLQIGKEIIPMPLSLEEKRERRERASYLLGLSEEERVRVYGRENRERMAERLQRDAAG